MLPHTFALQTKCFKIMVTTNEKQAGRIKSVFVNHFNIDSEQFDWEKSLEELDGQFKILGNLIFS